MNNELYAKYTDVCRYYNGCNETENQFANMEADWIENLSSGYDFTELLEQYKRDGVDKEYHNDGIAETFKALLYDRIKHYGGDINSFRNWYNEYTKVNK